MGIFFKRCGIFLFGILCVTSALGAQAVVTLTDEASIPGVIKAMTLDEKAKLVFGVGMGTATRVNGVAGGTFAIPRLGIPEVDVADGPAGLRLGGVTGGVTRTTTAFPIPTSMAATWDLGALEKAGASLGYEMKEYGVDILLGPALNIQRDPLGGRNFEYYTEDPFLNGKVSASFVKGIQSQGVGATLKHFALNNTETYRQNINEIVSERALHEIYLAGFEMAVKEAQPWCIMSAYPAINGTPASQNPLILDSVLRKDWGFDGLVMSDWFAVKDAIAGLKGGTNLNMPSPSADLIVKAVKDGTLSESTLDASVSAILSVVIKTPVFKGYKPSNNPDKKAYIPFVRNLAADGMVLLKNEENSLPVAKDKKLALFGSNAYNFIVGGGGSAEVNPDYSISLTDGFKTAGYQLIETTAAGTKLVEGLSAKDIAEITKRADIAVLSIGRYSSEGSDKYTMDMNDNEVALIRDVSAAFHKAHKKLVVLLNIGAPLEIASWEKYADAILLTWQPGQEAGNAVDDVVSGAVNPSGKLPETFPVKYGNAPASLNFPRGDSVMYGEDLYVGYRWYDKLGIEPLYAFGYGLSYTTFEYSNLKLSRNTFDLDSDAAITVTVDIKNTGKIKGKEVAQLYVSDIASLIARPVQELKSFAKVELKSGETKTVTFNLDKRSFSAWDDSTHAWVAAPGSFALRVGSSSRDIRLEGKLLATGGAAFAITGDTAWGKIQTSGAMAKIVAKYIGDKAMNSWYAAWVVPKETLFYVLKASFDANPLLKGNDAKQKELMDQIIAELNTL